MEKRGDSADNDSDDEAVVAFAGNSLQRGCTETRFRGDHLSEAANALDIRIGAVGIDYLAIAHDVVGNDERAGPREFEGPFEIFGIAGFVGVDEDEVEGRSVFLDQGGEGLRSRANAQVYAVRESRGFKILFGDLCVPRFQFEGDDAAVMRECAGEP